MLLSLSNHFIQEIFKLPLLLPSLCRDELWSTLVIIWIWYVHNDFPTFKTLCLTKHHAVEAYWGSGGIAPLIL